MPTAVRRTASADPVRLQKQFAAVRRATERLAEPLSPEDCQVQSMPDASPVKWHLAHTTWFFETFVLGTDPGYKPVDPQFGFLFNSYYDAVGPRHPRPERGLLSRPGLGDIRRYRTTIDERVSDLLQSASPERLDSLHPVLTLGLHHEQQHQELILTDVQARSEPQSLAAALLLRTTGHRSGVRQPRLVGLFPAGLQWIGHAGDSFAFDNESPRHRVLVEPFRSPPAGHQRRVPGVHGGGRVPAADLWLSDGWATCRARGWAAPLYWEQGDGSWWYQPVRDAGRATRPSRSATSAITRRTPSPAGPVPGLPTEAEWEIGGRGADVRGALPGRSSACIRGRSSMSGRRAGAALRRRLGVDRQSVRAVPRLSPRGRRPGRV